ncbi:hypothetical protein [Lentzea nigeriaca]|uniref:hypothetical protein n=1 Tax=Lentzea nigeriaca TaxID=1128665 RepID=UPI001957694F|nr:hypothetical protein [Lentzea nigeriaca]MBM7861962.1 hypothetical protein [Lentzea nigeriaca]
MAVVRGQPEFGAGNAGGEPPAVGGRGRTVAVAVQQQGGRADGRRVETPRRDVGEVVVDQWTWAVGQRGFDDLMSSASAICDISAAADVSVRSGTAVDVP